MRVFWNSSAENIGILSEKACSRVPFSRSCMNTIYSLLLDALQIHSERAQKGKDVIKIRKFPKNLSKTVPFSLTLQSCSPEFLTSANTDSKKNVFFEYSEIVGSLPKKGLKWTLIKNLFIHFWEDVGKTAVMKVLENYLKKS